MIFGRKHDDIDLRRQAVFLTQAEQIAGQLVAKTTELQQALQAMRAERAEHKDENHDR